MGDPISILRGLSNESKARDEELRIGFKQLESNLVEASGGLEIRGRAKTAVSNAMVRMRRSTAIFSLTDPVCR